MALLRRIAADDAARPSAETHVILLGDLIDRGPVLRRDDRVSARLPPGLRHFPLRDGQSRGGDARLAGRCGRRSACHRLARVRRHPDARQLRNAAGNARFARRCAGGGITRLHPARASGFPARLRGPCRDGDYLFVHAGIRPGVPLARQTRQGSALDTRRFPRRSPPPPAHGGTRPHDRPAPVFRPNRIGLDTGAYRTGVLTALGLEGKAQWVLATAEERVSSEATHRHAVGS